MGSFYKKCQNLAKKAGVLETDETQIETTKEQGRSMVEMLGVLAVVGVLSVGAISGYRYAMNKYRANQVTNELNLLSHQVAVAMMSKNGVSGQLKLGEPYDTNHKLASSGYALAFGCGESGANADCAGQTKYYMQVSGLPKSVCQELAKTRSLLQYADNDSEVVCTADSDNTLAFAFDAEKAVSTAESSDTGSDEPLMSFSGAGEWDPFISDPIVSVSDGVGDRCSGRGTWYDFGDGTGYCSCGYDWSGDDCSKCSGHAYNSAGYHDGKCACAAGYRGDDCEIEDLSVCSGNGWWFYTGCFCDTGWGGTDCSENYNQVKCSGNGIWYNSQYGSGYCSCDSGFVGDDCSEDYNQKKCSGNGTWYKGYYGEGSCSCNTGWGGTDCSENYNQIKCSGHGTWYNQYGGAGGYCSCEAGFEGSDCSENLNLSQCSGNGTWQGYACSCNEGWGGSDCSECSGHIHLIYSFRENGKCVCQEGYRGDDCEIEDPNTCSGHGHVYYGWCSCYAGWTGSNCETKQ